jgi:predicted HD phosphohydrolase
MARMTAARSVADVLNLLARYAVQETPIAGDIPSVLVSHGVQCAEVLAVDYPDDLVLQIAGLLHDVGLLLAPGDELGHPQHGADYVRELFGLRCADLIGMHVDAQRYLEMTVDGYRVTPPPTSALAPQPQPMTESERQVLERHALFGAAVALRRADDRACNSHRRERDLSFWAARMKATATEGAGRQFKA